MSTHTLRWDDHRLVGYLALIVVLAILVGVPPSAGGNEHIVATGIDQMPPPVPALRTTVDSAKPSRPRVCPPAPARKPDKQKIRADHHDLC